MRFSSYRNLGARRTKGFAAFGMGVAVGLLCAGCGGEGWKAENTARRTAGEEAVRSPDRSSTPSAVAPSAGAFGADVAGPAASPEPAGPRPRIGMNLSGVVDWNTELPFVDIFRQARPWVSQREGQPWGRGPELDLDARGWVRRIEPGCYVDTVLFALEKGRFPSGDYTVLYEGDGEIEMWGAGRIRERAAGRLVAEVDASREGSLFLRIRRTDPENYVRNIRVLLPGFEAAYAAEPFHPRFLERWRGMAALRFMDWMATNNSKIRAWSERPTPESATFAARGVALEWMIDLCNRLQADPWFCMPHEADDDYVRNFARMARERLAPGLKVYVEYSNEVWNGMFEQHRWAGREGIRLGFAAPDKPWEGAWRYTAWRSKQIFAIWEEVFGGRERLVRVLASQAANAYVSGQICEFQDAARQADALAIAPYISLNVPPAGGGLTADVVEKWSVDELLDRVETRALPEAIEWIRKQKEVADRHGLKLLAYEAGQHLVGVGGGENRDAMTRLFHAANRHPRMGSIYDAYYAAWEAAGGDLLCHFASVAAWSKWGSWGILEYHDQPEEQAPKFISTMRWARKWGGPARAP